MLRVSFRPSAAPPHSGGQADHVASIESYVGDVCDRPSAFRGVLNLFEGSYSAGVNAALSGLQNSVDIGDKMRTELIATRDDFVEADLASYKLMRDALGDLGAIEPYQLPTGDDDYQRGGTPPPASPGGEDEELDGLDSGDYRDAARDQFFRDTQHETDQPSGPRATRTGTGTGGTGRPTRTATSDASTRTLVTGSTRTRATPASRRGTTAGPTGEPGRGARRGQGRPQGPTRGPPRLQRGPRHRRSHRRARQRPLQRGHRPPRQHQRARRHLDKIHDNHEQAEDLDDFRDRDEDEELQDWGAR